MKNFQSAVQWLVGEFTNLGYLIAPSFGHSIIDEKIEQAKQMESEQQQKMVDDALTNYELGWSDRKKQFSIYEHKETITSADTKVSTSFLDHVPDAKKMVEISDEEIEKKGWEYTFVKFGEVDDFMDANDGFIDGAKWYREQLKKK